MMDADILSIDNDTEEGELSDTSEEVYTPLQRPASLTHNITAIPTPATIIATAAAEIKCTKMEADCTEEEDEILENKSLNNPDDEDECQSDISSSSSEDSSDTCLDKVNKDKKSKHKKRHIKRTVMVRIHPTSTLDGGGGGAEQKKARFKKYDIWTAALQEEALTENMRGCDVTQNGFNDRSVENYDFSLRYRLNGENSLKRRLSNSADDLSDSDQQQPHSKRQRPSSRAETKSSSSSTSSSSKRSVYERLGKRRDFRDRRRSSPCSGSDSNSYDPKHIEDLEEIGNRAAVDVAKEMAIKLHEQKDDLLVRVVEILGTELPLKIYKETQRIEAEGGMTIKNGQRRRTPGGVFLFLLKHNETLTNEEQKAIFSEDRHNANKKQKDIRTIMRDRKVEELKKRLCEQVPELPSLSTRKELMLLGDESNQKQNEGALSNPPPSPEACEEDLLDLKSIPINHVANDGDEVDVTEKPSTSHGIKTNILQTYDDDLLDVNCGDMDFF